MIPKDWMLFWKEEQNKPYLKNLLAFLEQEYSEQVCYPAKHHILKALEGLRPLASNASYLDKTLIMGLSKRTGLPFRLTGVKPPPSLRNIFKEYENDLCLPKPLNGDLNAWRKEGVLLLNTALSVRQGKPGSHKNKGWEIFTSNLITYVLAKSDHAGFICFGQPARNLQKSYGRIQ